MLGPGLSDRILLGREDYHDSVESIRVLFRIRAQPQLQQPSIPVLVLEQVQDNHMRPRTPRTTLLSPNPDESYKFRIKSHPTGCPTLAADNGHPMAMAYCGHCQESFPNNQALKQHKKDSYAHWHCDDRDL